MLVQEFTVNEKHIQHLENMIEYLKNPPTGSIFYGRDTSFEIKTLEEAIVNIKTNKS